MATEKTTGCRAVDYGDQVAGLRNVCDDLVGAVAEGLGEHCAAGFISRRAQLRFWPRRAASRKGRRRRAHAMTGQTPARPAHPVPSKPEQPT
jgi:hypothetical protein